MANLFDADNAPTVEPTSLVLGDFVQWKRTDLIASYPVATHSAQWVARKKAGGAAEIKVTATENASYYLFSISSSTSSAFTVGKYFWQLEVTETASGNRIVVDRGETEIIPDLDVNAADPRSHAEIMVDKIQALLEGRADRDVSSYSIQGRSIAKMNIADLLQWRDYYKKEAMKEKRDRDIANGRKTNATVKARFL